MAPKWGSTALRSGIRANPNGQRISREDLPRRLTRDSLPSTFFELRGRAQTPRATTLARVSLRHATLAEASARGKARSSPSPDIGCREEPEPAAKGRRNRHWRLGGGGSRSASSCIHLALVDSSSNLTQSAPARRRPP